MSRTAVTFVLTKSDHTLLQKIYNRRSVPEFLKYRIQAVLCAATGLQNKEIAAAYNLEVHFIGVWRNRFAKQYRKWQETDEDLRPAMSESLIIL